MIFKLGNLLVFVVFIYFLSKGLKKAIWFVFVFSFFYSFLNRIMIYTSGGEPSIFISYHFLYNLLFSICALLYILRLVEGRENPFKNKADIFVGVYLALASIMIFHPNNSILSGIWGFKDNALPIFWYILAREMLESREDIKNLGKYLAIYSIIASLYSFYQVYFGLPAWDEYWFKYQGLSFFGNWFQGKQLRAFGFTSGFQENYIVIAGILIFLLLLIRNNTKYLIFSIASYTLLNIFSVSRAAIAMMVIGLYFVLTSRHLQSRRVLLYATILPVLYLLLLTAQPFLIQTGRIDLIRFAEMTNPFEADTVAGKGQRLYLWHIYFQNLIKEPIGVGMGNLSQSFYIRMSATSWLAPHNNFLQIGIGYSWLGLICFIITLAYMFISSFRKVMDQSEINFNKDIAAIKIGILASWIAGAMFNNVFTGHMAKIFWLFMGIKIFEAEEKTD